MQAKVTNTLGRLNTGRENSRIWIRLGLRALPLIYQAGR